MLKKSSNNQKGFTIIEVLIVLAIAGLILLIVFLAVPALQRNSRNTQRKNDVASMLSGISEYVNNNSGALPAGKGGTGTTLIFGATANPAAGTEVKLGYYDPASVTWSTAGTVTNNQTEETITIVTKAKCSPTGPNAVAGPSRGFVALYAVESGSSLTKVCQEG